MCAEDLNAAGLTLGDEEVRFAWNLDIYGISESYFETGVSACGIPWDHGKMPTSLICRVNKQKPSHTKVFLFL